MIRRSATGTVEELSGGELPLGVLPDGHWSEGRSTLAPGDRVLLFTDGVLEAGDPPSRLYGPDRLQAEFAASGGAHPREAIARIVADVHSFCAGQHPPDDVTVLIVERTGPG